MQILLTRGLVTEIDDKDADLAEFKWCADSEGYATRNARGLPRETIRLHCVIMERVLGRTLKEGELVDHRDTNIANNRRTNLRLANKSQNNMNRGVPQNNTSGYKGVSWSSRDRKWYAKIQAEGRSIHVGVFDTPEEASEAYKTKARELHGEFYRET